MRLPFYKPEPNYYHFTQVLKGEVVPGTVPLVEMFQDYPVVRSISKDILGLDWVDLDGIRDTERIYWKNLIEVQYQLGYDYVRVSGGLDFRYKTSQAVDVNGNSRSWFEEGSGMITCWDDFERYPWPNLDNVDFWFYEFVARNLPEGMGLMVCPTSGFLEVPLDMIFGYENLCYLLYDDPELVAAVFQKAGELIYGFYEKLVGLPDLFAFFQGDDMGYKTGTLISADALRKYSLPWHKKTAALAHDNGLLYLLHSCGHIDEIMDDLIDDVKIDGRHSFEDEGNPVIEFKRKYGDRIAVLGGVDMDKLCRLPEPEVRMHVQHVLDVCADGGRFALGSGNSVASFVPIGNYLAMIEEGLKYADCRQVVQV